MSKPYAEVIIDITHKSVDRPFSYRIPENLRERMETGAVVRVPFGKSGRLIQGYCIRLSDSTDVPEEKLKDIDSIVTEGLGSEAKLISLAAWMRSRYGCTMIQALKTVLPVRAQVQVKQQTTLRLLLSEQEAQEKLQYYAGKHQMARWRLLNALVEEGELDQTLVKEKLHIQTPVITALAQQGVLERVVSMRAQDIAPQQKEIQTRYILNASQHEAVSRICGEWEEPCEKRRYLIHGITGSGKTLVYMELIEKAISYGQQAIVLIPEIALTYQTVMRFYHRFGSKVAFINSRLSKGERFTQFERAKNGEISVMIGPRSALFTPFPNLGLIVIDEEHEGAYRSETMPRYWAVETAWKRADIEHAALVLGSATPSMESYYAARQGKLQLLTLNERASGSLPDVKIVDMREEMRSGSHSMLSRPLQEQMEKALGRHEQIMLFLNRRGYAGFVSCRSCGHVIMCPHCEVALSLHKDRGLVCHYCGHVEPQPDVCPECGSPYLGVFKAGTEQVMQQVQQRFPAARVLRMDADTTARKGEFEKILGTFEQEQADILIGTQMIVKGHDFPKVTVVGVLAADLSLNMSDYRASENTFQLLTQAVGRAGRSYRPGTALIQTYDPEHYAVTCAAAQNYNDFYDHEIFYRSIAGYPPAGAMTAIRMSGDDEEYIQMAADYLGRFALRLTKKYQIQVLGPVFEPIARVQDQFKMVIYLKGDSAQNVEEARDVIERYIRINDGFNNIYIQFEVEGG